MIITATTTAATVPKSRLSDLLRRNSLVYIIGGKLILILLVKKISILLLDFLNNKSKMSYIIPIQSINPNTIADNFNESTVINNDLNMADEKICREGKLETW